MPIVLSIEFERSLKKAHPKRQVFFCVCKKHVQKKNRNIEIEKKKKKKTTQK